MDAASIALGFAITMVMIVVGYRMRTVSHAILPLRDPVFLMLIAVECTIMILDYVGILPLGLTFVEDDTLFITDRGSLALLMMGAGDVGYIAGYIMCRPGDVLYLDMPDETLTYTEVAPMVWYVHNGNTYVMPQTLGGIVASFLGAKHPADIPTYEIARRRSCTFSNGIRMPMTMDVVPVSLHETETITIGVFRIGSRKIRDENRNIIAESPRYLWHPEVTSHRVRFSSSVTDDHLAFWVKDGIYRESIEDAIEAEERAARLEIQMQSAKYDAGADLVAGLVSLSTDAPGSHEEILARIEAERKRRGEADAEHS